jgi:type II secretory pathway component PulJ
MKSSKKGFTILEIVVSVSLFTFIILLSGSMYSLAQKSYNKGQERGELAQNIRVSLDRITRELRQSVNIVTTLPETADDPENLPSEEIFFQDGHDISQITYLYYYLNGTNLMRSRIVYYFDEDPETYVSWDSVDANEEVLENRVVGEYFDKMEFWGANGLIYISLRLIKGQNTLNIDTNIFTRN